MSVCGNRTDSPGFFTSCQDALHGPCACAEQVKADRQEATCQTSTA